MDRAECIKISKFLSMLLRHKPEEIALSLDENGWADINDIVDKSKEIELSVDKIIYVIETSDKKRFQLSDDRSKIRANQGHSIPVNLDLKEKEPPEILYHGTATRFIKNIRKHGLTSQKRNHVHLSNSIETAMEVGKRYGEPILLKVHAQKMYKQGMKFYLSENGVWLTNNVPIEFIL